MMCAAVRRSSLLKVGSTQYYASSSPGINLACSGIDSLSVSYHNQQALFLSILFSTILWSSRAWCVIVSMLPYFRRLRPSVVFIFAFCHRAIFCFSNRLLNGKLWRNAFPRMFHQRIRWMIGYLFFFFQIWEPPDLSIVGQERGRCIVHWPSILEKTLMNVTASNFPWLRGRQEEDKKKKESNGAADQGSIFFTCRATLARNRQPTWAYDDM